MGFADFYIEKWGAEIQGCSVYQKDGARWINLPGSKYTNREGEDKFAPFLRFREKKLYEAFIKQAKDAVDKWIEVNGAGPSYSDEPVQEEIPF